MMVGSHEFKMQRNSVQRFNGGAAVILNVTAREILKLEIKT